MANKVLRKTLHSIGLDLIVFVLGFIVGSCTSYKQCVDKYGQLHTDTVWHVDTLAYLVKGDTIRSMIHDTVNWHFTETDRTRLTVRRDSVFTFIECAAKPDTVYQRIEIPRVLTTVEFRDKPRTPWWTWALAGAAISLLVLVLIRR